MSLPVSNAIPQDSTLIDTTTASHPIESTGVRGALDLSSDSLLERLSDTLRVQLVENIPFYEEPAFWISVISILISFTLLFFQFIWWGCLKVAEINSVGLWINYSGGTQPGPATNPEFWEGTKSRQPDGSPQDFLFVLPLLFWNTGNKSKEIINMRLRVKFGRDDLILKPNKFVSDLGVGEKGNHERPRPTNWIHQIVLRPRESEVKFVEFYGRDDSGTIELEEGGTISGHVDIKTAGKSSFSEYQSFEISADDIIENKGGSSYTVYGTKEAES